MPRRVPARTRRTSGFFSGLSRTHAVWLCFLGSMTVVGGALLALDTRQVPRVDGLMLAPLAAAGSRSTAEFLVQTRRPLDAERWRSIVIHHSGSSRGTPASIAGEHEAAGLKGLGHHFLIGNGSGMEDGELHVGYRWLDQLPGAHALGDHEAWYNQHAISICLVGDGDRRSFTPAQMRRLRSLLQGLQRALDVPDERVVLHREIAPVSSPGRLFNADELRAWLATDD